MDIKCVFSDLDRTFLDDNGRISEKNRKTVEMLIKRGIHFVPATGRAFHSLPADIFGIPGVKYCITGNGVAVCDLTSGETVVRTLLPSDIPEKFLEFVKKVNNPAFEVYVDGRAHVTEDYYDEPSKFGQDRVQYVRETRTPERDLEAFMKTNRNNLDGLTIIAPHGRDEEIYENAKSFFKGVYVTHADSIYIELSGADSGKHNGMKQVCKLLDISLKNCIAFGDNDNDVEMLTEAGFGICVANGTEKCLRAADGVTASNSEDGFAKGIAHILNLERES